MKMSRQESEAFLTEVHVGILSINIPDRGPLAVPIWYAFEPGGEITFTTERDSYKMRFLKAGVRISVCAQEEERPYKYVSVEGPISMIGEAEVEDHQRPIARRYLGIEEGDRYVEEEGGMDEVVVKMSPERWYSAYYE